MVLHTLNCSPAAAAFGDCLRLLAAGDALLLMGDAVYAGIPGTAPREALDGCAAELYILRDDAAVAGVLQQLEGLVLVDIAGFVELTERYPRQLAWY